MNTGQFESAFELEAKTCGCSEKRSVAYSIVDNFHGHSVGNKEIISGQIEACEKLLIYTQGMMDRVALLEEISRLRLVLKFI